MQDLCGLRKGVQKNTHKIKPPAAWRQTGEAARNKRGVVFYEYYIRRPAAGKAS